LTRVHLDNKNAPVDDWAAAFDLWVSKQIRARKLDDLLSYRHNAPHARLSAPTTEHFDPLFVTLGAAFADESVETIFEGFQYGNLSMRSFAFRA
jgi:4,5-DOPA dioxygenase extradiol